MHQYLYDLTCRPYWAFTHRVDRAHIFPTQKAARLASKDCYYPREEREIVRLEIRTTPKLIKKITPPPTSKQKKKKKKRVLWH